MAASPILPGEATADLCDRLGSEARVCHLPFKSYGGLQALAAPIACVQTCADPGPLRAWLDTPGQGRVLVVDGGGLRNVALLGERMAELSLRNGWRGAIIHGAVRDVAALAQLNFAVLALCAVPQRASVQTPASAPCAAHAALRLGDIQVCSGDWMAFDADGVVFLRTPA